VRGIPFEDVVFDSDREDLCAHGCPVGVLPSRISGRRSTCSNLALTARLVFYAAHRAAYGAASGYWTALS